MPFVTTRNVGYAGKIYDFDAPIARKKDHEAAWDELVGLGAIVEGKPTRAAAEAPAEPKPLAEQSLEELKATAAAEQVPDVDQVDDEAKLREAIEAHRTKQAKA